MRINRIVVGYFLFGMLWPVTGCQKKTPSVAVLPSPAIPVFSVSVPPALLPASPELSLASPPPPVPPPPAVLALDEAEKSYDAGEYGEAARYYEQYLDMAPSGDKRDQALFKLAVISASPSNAMPNWVRVSALMKRLIEECPESPYWLPAKVIVGLHSEVAQLTADSQKRDQRIKQLSGELDKLKKVDAERRKRD